MSPNRKYPLLILVGVLLLPFATYAQTVYSIKEYKLTVQGSSTLHDWESDVSQTEATATITLQDKKLTDIKEVTVKIPVTSIKSTKGKMMDSKTYEAFNAEKNPNIQYKLSGARITASGDGYTLVANGTLTMAGTSRPVELTAKGKVMTNGDVQIIGSKKLNMKDFNMVPPTAMMGTIKVGEEVTVNFNLTLTHSSNNL
jgi:polyisoprenoid-binding protein YceI